MKTVKYEIKLKGLATPDGTISVKALLDLMGSLTDCAERGEEIFAEMPQAFTDMELFGEVLQKPDRKDWLQKVWAQWPGDKSIEEILQNLKN
jgi:hypothetical protein